MSTLFAGSFFVTSIISLVEEVKETFNSIFSEDSLPWLSEDELSFDEK